MPISTEVGLRQGASTCQSHQILEQKVIRNWQLCSTSLIFAPGRSSLHQLKTTKKTWSSALRKIRVHPFAPLHLPILPELLHVSKIRRRRWQMSLILWNNGGFEPQWSRFYKKNSVFWWVSSDAFQRCLLLGCQGKLYKQIYVQKYYSNLKIFRQWPFL